MNTKLLTKFIASIIGTFIFIGIISPKPKLEPKVESTSVEITPNSIANVIPSPTPDPKITFTKVINVIDGDTFTIEGGVTVRMIGIDTPETVHPSKPVQCYGKEASLKTEELLQGKEIKLEKDISETDRYNRLLRYVYIGDIFVNEYLVKEGFAKSSSYPPDIKYQDKFIEGQRKAQEENKGLWNISACSTATTNYAPTTNTQTGSNTGGAYTCNCSKTCPNLSCDEAQYQLNTCGCGARDADDDGIACDSQCQ